MTSWVKIYAGLVGLACLAAIAVALQANSTSNDTQRRVTFDIRQSQFDACVNSPLREQVRSEFVDLKEDVLIPILRSSGSTIQIQPDSTKPPLDAIDYLRQRIDTIKDRIPDPDCKALYPALDGQKLERPKTEQNGSNNQSREEPDDPAPRPTDNPPLGPPVPGSPDGGGTDDGVGGSPSAGGSSDAGPTSPDQGEEGGGDQPAAPQQPAPDPPSLGNTIDGAVQGVDDITGGAVCNLPLRLCP